MPSEQTWIIIGTILTAAASIGALAFALIRAASTSVKAATANSTEVAKSIEHLTGKLSEITGRVDAYIAAERNRDEKMEDWRRAVEAQLAGLKVNVEQMNNTLTLLVQSSVRGRRGTGVTT